ncbi:DUF724 domain-containing protein 5-like [Apium graveolens]|uniref:DUF724 domain-containing protein 5-like n=1 Tax=Apium graveolens TaxID=4045 RepID=UPI003D7AE0AC
MQAFGMFPQNPRFQTLFSEKGGSREGSTITLMVDFINVVEKTCILPPDDPKNILEDTVEILHDLEYNGFQVNVVGDRVVQFLSIKDMRDELKAKSKEATDQIEEKEEKINDLDNRIGLLQEVLSLTLSTKELKDSNVAHLK